MALNHRKCNVKFEQLISTLENLLEWMIYHQRNYIIGNFAIILEYLTCFLLV